MSNAALAEPGYEWFYYDTGAAYAGMSERALKRAVHAGRVEHARLGLRVRFTKEMLDRWVADSTVAPKAVAS